MTNQKRTDRDKFYGEKGFALGTAILTATDLKEMYALVAKVVDSLSDPTSAVLRDRIERRLLAANIDIKNHTPIRSFANRSISSPDNVNQETLAHSNQLEKLETAISKRKAIRLQIQYKGKFRKKMDSRADKSEVWPLQILFHNIAWYLAYESKEPDSLGLLTVARLDRLKLVELLDDERDVRQMSNAQQRIQLLCRRCGGIFFTNQLKPQKDVLRDLLDLQNRLLPSDDTQPIQHKDLPSLSRKQVKDLIEKGSMTLVRFRCTAEVFAFMREGFNRYPPEQMRLSGPRPGDTWKLPDIGIEQLQPCLDENEPRPYPVEFILPSWTISTNDFKGWLFGFGSRIVIEAPELLRKEHMDFGAGIAGLYPASATEDSGDAG
jgi:hypothetical protein